jgi:hypothetical protein
MAKKKEIDYDDLTDLFNEEWNSDNSLKGQGVELKCAYETSNTEVKKGMDQAFICLCGYSLKTLINRLEGKDPDYPTYHIQKIIKRKQLMGG